MGKRRGTEVKADGVTVRLIPGGGRGSGHFYYALHFGLYCILLGADVFGAQ